MKHISYFLFFVAALLTLQSCEEAYIPDTNQIDQQYVVEGYIENGANALPTYVLVTRSIPYISSIGPDLFSTLFVKGAMVTVNDGEKEVQLTQLCTADLPPDIRKLALETLGFNPDSTMIDLCVYVDLTNQITKKVGQKYDLKVEVDGNVMTASTTIPPFAPLFDFRWDDPPGEPSDSLARLWTKIADPDGPNFYRYLTAENDGRLIPPFQSTTDDVFFEGKEFEFPISKAETRDGDFDPESFGLFSRGDSITIKWCTLDKEHFDFWNTRDFASNSGGPFSSYTRIKTNIKGGLGIWGGYSVGTYRLYCPPK